MTATEFSNEFDVLYNNLASNQAPGLNEYEKSVLLTKAQEQLIRDYFNPRNNKVQQGFDGSPKRQIDLSALINTSMDNVELSGQKLDPRSICYQLPADVFMIINESMHLIADDAVKGIRQIIPITYEDYMRFMSKPYKEPLKWQAWRLLTRQGTSNTIAEVILTSNDNALYSDSTKRKYVCRYVKRQKPIILTDFSEAFGEAITIAGENGSSALYTKDADGNIINPCELDESVHEEILQRAVELAKASYSGGLNEQLSLGVNSQTDVGMVSSK